MGTKYISDTVSYLDDIKPHLLSVLYAGVGSGKNHFINQLILLNFTHTVLSLINPPRYLLGTYVKHSSYFRMKRRNHKDSWFTR